MRYFRLYVLASLACYAAHALAEHQYYMSCRRTLWTTMTMTASPYCLFLSRVSAHARHLPVRALEAVLAPMVQIQVMDING